MRLLIEREQDLRRISQREPEPPAAVLRGWEHCGDSFTLGRMFLGLI